MLQMTMLVMGMLVRMMVAMMISTLVVLCIALRSLQLFAPGLRKVVASGSLLISGTM